MQGRTLLYTILFIMHPLENSGLLSNMDIYRKLYFNSTSLCHISCHHQSALDVEIAFVFVMEVICTSLRHSLSY